MPDIHSTALVGVELRPLQGMLKTQDIANYGPPVLADDVYIGPYCIIGLNVRLGKGVIVDAFCKLDPNASVGEGTLLVYRAAIGSNTKIGRDCVIGGTVSEGTEIGDRCRSFGQLIHSHHDSVASWDHRPDSEPGPELLDDSFVAHGALVIGQVTIGPKAYVCAGSVITRDVPERHIAFGVNQIVKFDQWPGSLSENPLFQGE